MESYDSVRSIQEDEYAFPYHYIADGQDGFLQVRHDTWGINYLATIEYLIERLRGEEFRSAVDIGCGDGRFTKELVDAFPGKRIVGVDVSSRAVALAKAMTPNVDYRCADITTGSIAETFDLAVLMEVYEHVHPASGPAFLDAVAGLLGDRGILYVTVPHVNKPVEPKHYRHFSAETLIGDLQARFEPLETIYIEKRAKRKKMIDYAFTNRLFVLNHKRLGGALYSYYRKHLFLAPDERSCLRLILRLRKR